MLAMKHSIKYINTQRTLEVPLFSERLTKVNKLFFSFYNHRTMITNRLFKHYRNCTGVLLFSLYNFILFKSREKANNTPVEKGRNASSYFYLPTKTFGYAKVSKHCQNFISKVELQTTRTTVARKLRTWR